MTQCDTCKGVRFEPGDDPTEKPVSFWGWCACPMRYRDALYWSLIGRELPKKCEHFDYEWEKRE